jgi:hypothetical protein
VKRVEEIESVMNVLDALNQGILPRKSNLVKGSSSLGVDFFKNRLNLTNIAIAGHSFGAVTSILYSNIKSNEKSKSIEKSKVKCCLALDAWWTPLPEVLTPNFLSFSPHFVYRKNK